MIIFNTNYKYTHIYSMSSTKLNKECTSKRKNSCLLSSISSDRMKRRKAVSKFKKGKLRLISCKNNSSMDINMLSERTNRSYNITLSNVDGNIIATCNCGQFFGETEKRRNCKHIASVFHSLLKNFVNSIPESSKNNITKLSDLFSSIKI